MNGQRCSVVKADIKGGPLAPDLKGVVIIRSLYDGSEVYVHITGLPEYKSEEETGGEPIGPFAFHMHETGDCTVGDEVDPFKGAGGHWNPDNQPHGNHAGDFPVLFSNKGTALMTFYTDRFKPDDAIGKAIIIHQSPDSYRNRPDSASPRLACGVLKCISGQ